jgi:hypothetical protein
MNIRMKHLVGPFIFLIAALPLWARTDKEAMTLAQPAVIGTQQLQPGVYDLKADEGKNEIAVSQQGKLIAQIPGRWVQLPQKASQSEVIMKDRTITNIQFDGRPEQFEVQSTPQ